MIHTNTPTRTHTSPLSKTKNTTQHAHIAGTPSIDELRRRIEARHNEELKKESTRKRRRRIN
jgi:hypothetical protein